MLYICYTIHIYGIYAEYIYINNIIITYKIIIPDYDEDLNIVQKLGVSSNAVACRIIESH